MKKFLNNLKAEASQIRLSKAEKARMRNALFGTASPVHVERSPYVFASLFSSTNFRMAMASVLMLVLVGTGTASAAQGALPGDLLYPVKLSITEKVEAALAPNAAERAALEVSFAERRVGEAQSLAAKGKLDPKLAAELSTKFDAHAESAETLTHEVEASEPGLALQLKTRLETSLSVNGAVLKRIGRDSGDRDTKEQSDTLGTRVIARAEGPSRAAAQARAFLAAPAADSALPKRGSSEASTLSMSATAQDVGTARAAGQLQEKASESLTKAKELFEEVKGALDATSTVSVQEGFMAADLHMSAGAEALGAERFEAAKESFIEALRVSNRLFALLTAEQKFNNHILRDLIDEDNSGSDHDD